LLSFSMVLQRSVLAMKGKQGKQKRDKSTVGTAITQVFSGCIYKKCEALLASSLLIILILISSEKYMQSVWLIYMYRKQELFR